MNEEEIIQKLKSGDSSAFRNLVDKYQLPVMNTCLGIIHHRHDAEDLAQDVFIEVFRSIQSFRADSKLSTWIYRIAVNKSINFIRKQKRKQWLLPLEDLFTGKQDTESRLTTETTPSTDIEKGQRIQKLNSAIDSLPESQRIAFTLHKYDELSYSEISEVMNLSISAVESLIHRAKINLQKKLWACYKKEAI